MLFRSNDTAYEITTGDWSSDVCSSDLFLRVGGVLAAMKGRSFDPQTESFSGAAAALGGNAPEYRRYTVEGEEKTLIVICKSAQTDMQYPRRFAKIKRNPL